MLRGEQDQRDIENDRTSNIGHEQGRKRVVCSAVCIDAIIQGSVDLNNHYVIDFYPSFNKKVYRKSNDIKLL